MTSQVVSEASYVRSNRSMKLSTVQSMSTKLYGKDLREYDELDIDSLLAKLTTEELEELNNDIDPDNSLLPPGQRCLDQTTKEPTGPFKREQLLRYLEEKAKAEKDWEEKVPYQPGVKREVAVQKESTVAMPIELDIDDEFSDALKAADENDLVDLAGILGMHSIINQMQYYNALKGVPQEFDQTSFNGVVKSTTFKLLPDEPPNTTDVDDCIRRLSDNDPSLVEININNMKHIPREKLVELIESTAKSDYLESFSMANTAVNDADVKGIITLVQDSKSLKNLNVESNFLSGELLAQIIRASLNNQSLVEFHAENQRAIVLGNRVEMDIARSIEENDTLLRVGISFQCMEARNRVSDALERNYERLRLKRIGADI